MLAWPHANNDNDNVRAEADENEVVLHVVINENVDKL